MPRKTRTPPSRDVLAELLRDRRDRTVTDVAAILGVSRAALERRAAEEGVLGPGSTVRWHDALRWLLEAWPAATLVAILGPDSALLPAGLHPLPLTLAPPAYLRHALRVQWEAAGPHAGTFEHYLLGLLQDAVEPSTVELLRGDAEFVRAYGFAEGEPDA